MPGIEVSEPLNPSAWTKPQQQAVYDELVTLLGITPGPDLPNQTDVELTATLHAVVNEIRVRGSSIVTKIDSIAFYDDTIQFESD